MRKPANWPKEGQERVVTGFLFLPRTLRTGRNSTTFETRWLERTSWVQRASVHNRSYWWSTIFWVAPVDGAVEVHVPK